MDVPLLNVKRVPHRAQSTDYELQTSTDQDDFQFKIVRKSTGAVM
jgi:hypothetical protein